MSQEQTRDENFYKRADAHIALANNQIDEGQINPVLSNDSLLYGAARFNSWIVAASFKNGEDMKNDKENALNYFTNAYRAMLEEHLDDYIKNFNSYMGPKES
ncbi:hypothetical protein MNB_SV-5-1335 [hydrothermal vent metagenome]|uniref:DUF3144 domain-containing protein n=1 Tax=hydrothermal vent metagenome TaxID=652676 RepID=A0A1W1EBR7_9ZZZZ